jgi:hypothetical protein
MFKKKKSSEKSTPIGDKTAQSLKQYATSCVISQIATNIVTQPYYIPYYCAIKIKAGQTIFKDANL